MNEWIFIVLGIVVVTFVAGLLWINLQATRYEDEVKSWLDDMNCPKYDFNLCMDYYHSGESSWNAAQAMMEVRNEP